MRIRFVIYLVIIISVFSTVLSARLMTGHLVIANGERVQMSPYSNSTVLLIPLDSRPPCTQYVEQLAAIAGISMLTPPSDILDNYKVPAKRQDLREWFLKNATTSDTAIVSIDMLIHGGLLASRLGLGTQIDEREAIDLLRRAKKENPRLQLYVFSIIPRLIIADTAEYQSYQKNITKYSLQKDLLLTFENPLDYDKFQELQSKLPPNIINRYESLYNVNKNFNYTLLNLVKEGIIDSLVVGQDDGSTFGIPNWTKAAVSHYAEQLQIMDRVFITRGTDEVALTILGHIAAKRANYSPKIYVHYSHPDAASVVMPFMPHSVDTTVTEKVHMIGGKRTPSLEQADFILYVHIGTHELNGYTYESSAKDIRAMLEAGNKVAVVDLTEDYYASQTLLPWLLKNNIPLLQLSAYAGWNTTSNSIGTAVSQLAVLGSNPTRKLSKEKALTVWSANTEFLLSRILDDWYFQKDIQPILNSSLRKSGFDPYNLGLIQHETNQSLQKQLRGRSQYLFRRHIAHTPVIIETSERPVQIIISDLTLYASLPWDRTFEVRLKPELEIVEVKR